MRFGPPRVLFACVGGLAAACGDARPEAGAAPTATAPAPAEAPSSPGIRFVECAESAGLRFRMNYLPTEQGEQFKVNLYDHGCGVSAGDADGDGRDDVFFCNQLGPCALFRNAGDGRFEDVTKASGELAASLEGKIAVAAAFADVDADGDEDLYVTTTRAGNVFLLNAGGGKFTDATKEAGLTLVAESEQPCFFDMDGDGALDLLVTNTARWTTDVYDQARRYFPGKANIVEMLASAREDNVAYRNDGSGRFTDVTGESGLKGHGWSGDVSAFDCDDDGDLDVVVGSMFGPTRLYRNDGKGRFADVTRETLGRTSFGAAGIRAFDYDGDARLDLFIADMHSDMWVSSKTTAAHVEESKKYATFFGRAIEIKERGPADDAEMERGAQFRTQDVLFGNTLFRNQAGGKFVECSEAAKVETWWPWAFVDGDFDADGHVDAFVPSGMSSPFFYWRSPLLRNRGDGTFEDVCREAGTEPPPGGAESPMRYKNAPYLRSARAATTLDFDGDGRLDLVMNNFNERAYLYRNVSAARHWCGLRLVGAGKNRDAVGALVRLKAGGRTQVRQVQAAGGYLAQSTNALHFGLGDVGEIESIEVVWQGGAKQTVKKPRIDALSTVTERAK